MELLAWILYGALLIGPYIALAIFCVVVVGVVIWGGFVVNRAVGFGTLAIVAAGAGLAAHRYMLQPAKIFNAACNSGIGIRVAKDAAADSYLIAYVPNFRAGLAWSTDATIEDAIANVAAGRVPYVEVEDWNDDSRRYTVAGELTKFRQPASGGGYFKLNVGSLGSPQCRWLMPEDVGKLPYHTYLSYRLNHPLNQQLLTAQRGKQCVAVDYVAAATARYAVEFSLDQPIDRNLVKHEIRIVDLQDGKALIGNSVAYQYKTEGVYTSTAFWIGNGKRHATCPMNLLAGKPLLRILKIGPSRRRGP